MIFFSVFISYTGGQSVSHVLLWQPFECDSMLFSENKYDDDDEKPDVIFLHNGPIVCRVFLSGNRIQQA